MWALLIAFAIGPGLILLHAIYVADHYEKEPIRNVLRYLGMGALVGVPAGLIEAVQQLGMKPLAAEHPLLEWAMLIPTVYVGVALVEELLKRLGVHICARRDAHINEPFDWVVYSVAVALGFATFENIFYVLEGGIGVALIRALTAVPSHAFNGTLMGARLAFAERAKLRGDAAAASRERRLAVLEPTVWHGTYDFFAFGSGLSEHQHFELLSRVFFGLLIVMVIVQWVIGIRRVRELQRVTGQAHMEPPILFPVTRPRWMHPDVGA